MKGKSISTFLLLLLLYSPSFYLSAHSQTDSFQDVVEGHPQSDDEHLHHNQQIQQMAQLNVMPTQQPAQANQDIHEVVTSSAVEVSAVQPPAESVARSPIDSAPSPPHSTQSPYQRDFMTRPLDQPQQQQQISQPQPQQQQQPQVVQQQPQVNQQQQVQRAQPQQISSGLLKSIGQRHPQTSVQHVQSEPMVQVPQVPQVQQQQTQINQQQTQVNQQQAQVNQQQIQVNQQPQVVQVQQQPQVHQAKVQQQQQPQVQQQAQQQPQVQQQLQQQQQQQQQSQQPIIQQQQQQQQRSLQQSQVQVQQQSVKSNPTLLTLMAQQDASQNQFQHLQVPLVYSLPSLKEPTPAPSSRASQQQQQQTQQLQQVQQVQQMQQQQQPPPPPPPPLSSYSAASYHHHSNSPLYFGHNPFIEILRPLSYADDNIVTLNLSHSHIYEIDSDAFVGQRFEHIDLSNNKLGLIHSRSFRIGPNHSRHNPYLSAHSNSNKTGGQNVPYPTRRPPPAHPKSVTIDLSHNPAIVALSGAFDHIDVPNCLLNFTNSTVELKFGAFKKYFKEHPGHIIDIESVDCCEQEWLLGYKHNFVAKTHCDHDPGLFLNKVSQQTIIDSCIAYVTSARHSMTIQGPSLIHQVAAAAPRGHSNSHADNQYTTYLILGGTAMILTSLSIYIIFYMFSLKAAFVYQMQNKT